MKLKKCTIMSAQVTYEIDHIYLLRDSTISSALIYFFFNVFYRYLKEKDHVKQNIKSITRNVYIAIKCTKYLFLCVLSLSKRKRSY